MAPRLIILGWDSATFEVAGPLLEEGRLPGLAGLLERGFGAPLRSTWPPMTDCAWTSAFTGVNAGAHGIFGSWYRAPGAYAPRYFSSRDRRSPALWELAPEARFLVWNVPMTYPPSEVRGAMVAGYGAPPGARMTDPAGLQDELAHRWDLRDLLDRAPHGSLEQFLDELLRGLEVQAEALPWVARRTDADCVVAVWPHIDRAQHFFWQFHTPGSAGPQDKRTAGSAGDGKGGLSSAIDRVYAAADAATVAVVEAFPDADVLVVSDHGAGPLMADVNLGSWLARRGDAAYAAPRSRPLLDLAWAMPPRARRLGRRLAPGMARRTLGATLTGQLGPFDWGKTRAFAGFHGDLWLNLKGREPQGTVERSDQPELAAELSAALLELKDPRTGAPVFAAVHRRDDIYSGPSLDLAPDLMLDSWSAGYRVAPGREPTDEVVIPPAALTGVVESWSSDHRPLGILAASGPRIRPGRADELALYDVCPTALALLEAAVPEGLDGRAATEMLDPAWLAAHPVSSAEPAGERRAEGEYSDAEADAVAAHLKDLGYIE